MKPLRLLPLFLLLLVTGSCEVIPDDGWIVDWYPVDVIIEAVDAGGNSIISPDMPGMSLTFKGETYTVKTRQPEYELPTKAYLAIMYGLIATPWVVDEEGNQQYRLVFGEIDGAKDMDEDLILNWPDGSKDVIHYHCSDHREGRNPRCNRSWKLNGKEHDGVVFKFVK